jgi:peptidoglycan-N-acetylglucosamine deacetylase
MREFAGKMEQLPILLAAAVAVGTYCRGAVAPSSQIFGRTVRFTGDSRTVALTFDDGPNPAVTPGLLDLLDRYEAKATFFMVGEHVAAAAELAKEIAARGHVIGNHTQTHPNLALSSPAAIRRELDACDEAICRATGWTPRWMRPPFGFRNPALKGIVHRRGGAGIVMWSKWAWDWKAQSALAVSTRLAKVKGGDILLLHDGDHRVLRGDRQHTADALKQWLPQWKEAGLRFVTLDALSEQA